MGIRVRASCLQNLRGIWINGMSIISLQKFTLNVWVITYKCFHMCVHHTNNYQSSLLTLHKRLVCVFITQWITSIVYCSSIQGSYICLSHEELPEYFPDAPYKVGMYFHYAKDYQRSLLMLRIRLLCMFIMQRITRVVYWCFFQG